MSEELKLVESEAGTAYLIVRVFKEMVASTTEEVLLNMTAAEADAFKMLSTMLEAAESPMPMETREGALKMVA